MDKLRTRRIKRATIFIVLIMVLVSFSPVTACDLADSQWPKDGHDNQNTGQSQYLGPQNNTTNWTANIEDGMISYISSNPIVGPDGTVYLGTCYTDEDFNPYGNLYAYKPNGTVKWNYTIPDGIILSTPAISSEGSIFFASFSPTSGYGNIYALSDSGVCKWNYTVPGATSIIESSPAIGSDGTVYFSSVFTDDNDDSYTNLYALTKDGLLKWNYTITDILDTDWVSSPTIGNEGTIYFGVTSLDNGFLYAISDSFNHALEKWSYVIPDGDYNEIVDSPSVGSDGTIYVGSNYYEGERGYGNFYALTDASDHADVKWNYIVDDGDDCGITSSPAIAKDGTIYFGSGFTSDSETNIGNLYALTDAVDHASFKWNFSTAGEIMNAPAIGSDGTVYFGDSEIFGTFYALNPDSTIKWSLETMPQTAAAISKIGTLYFGSYDDPDCTLRPVLYAIQGPPSNLNVKTTVDNTNPNVGDTVTVTYKVGNDGPNTAYSTVLRFVIPAGMQFVKAWTDTGIISYDTLTNTVTWDLGDVPTGDPWGYVQLLAQNIGQIVIKPLVSTITDDPNLSNNIQSVTINVHAATKNTTTDSTSTSHTIGMQETGSPIPMLLLAILMVMGSIFVKKKR